MSKTFKLICIAILIVACLFNIIMKLVNKHSLEDELRESATKLQNQSSNLVTQDIVNDLTSKNN